MRWWLLCVLVTVGQQVAAFSKIGRILNYLYLVSALSVLISLTIFLLFSESNFVQLIYSNDVQ